jgi:hypothetical protein
VGRYKLLGLCIVPNRWRVRRCARRIGIGEHLRPPVMPHKSDFLSVLASNSCRCLLLAESNQPRMNHQIEAASKLCRLAATPSMTSIPAPATPASLLRFRRSHSPSNRHRADCRLAQVAGFLVFCGNDVGQCERITRLMRGMATSPPWRWPSSSVPVLESTAMQLLGGRRTRESASRRPPYFCGTALHGHCIALHFAVQWGSRCRPAGQHRGHDCACNHRKH